jgi:hypothetical protein
LGYFSAGSPIILLCITEKYALGTGLVLAMRCSTEVKNRLLHFGLGHLRMTASVIAVAVLA